MKSCYSKTNQNWLTLTVLYVLEQQPSLEWWHLVQFSVFKITKSMVRNRRGSYTWEMPKSLKRKVFKLCSLPKKLDYTACTLCNELRQGPTISALYMILFWPRFKWSWKLKKGLSTVSLSLSLSLSVCMFLKNIQNCQYE